MPHTAHWPQRESHRHEHTTLLQLHTIEGRPDDFLEAEIDEDKINEKIETIIQVRIVSVYGDVMCLCMETSNTILN